MNGKMYESYNNHLLNATNLSLDVFAGLNVMESCSANGKIKRMVELR